VREIPYRGKNNQASREDANRAHAKRRSPRERANAQFETGRIRCKLRCCPRRVCQPAKAIRALQIREADVG
jgi:hypothetical protein